MQRNRFGVGIIGCGGFARLAGTSFARNPGVSVVAICEPNEQAAAQGVELFSCPVVPDVDSLVSRDDVDVVYIATPPSMHHGQALAALNAGKHAIVEKPLAVNLQQADELVKLARSRDLLLVANLMQRYNPIYDAVRRVIDSGVMGDVLHGFFENYARDEQLPPEHWFWNHDYSGGIFIEHGVHFFDMFAGWLGDGEVVAAQRSCRASGVEDQVLCTVRYGREAHVNFYHGFTQFYDFDRQMFRLLFERGDITLHEWVPTLMVIRAMVDRDGLARLQSLLPGARVEKGKTYEGAARNVTGRHKRREVDYAVEITVGEGDEKMDRYAQMLQAMFADQAAWINDRSHTRKITDENGHRSLAMAVRATELARVDG